MTSALTKSERLQQVEQLLLAHPEGMRRSEIARRLGIHRSTATRYVDELSRTVPLVEEDEGRVWLDRNRYLNSIRVTIHESLAVFLAIRLMADATDRLNPHASAAMRKLGQSLKDFSPRIAQSILGEADRMESPERRRDARYLSVVETLTHGWAESRKVQIEYRSARSGQTRRYSFAVYLIVPYAPGQSLLAMGRCDGEDHLRTLRVDRIVSAALGTEGYVPPEPEELSATLKNAWGIWYSDQSPVEVVLRFSSRVAPRVRETLWHRNQVTEDLPDGGVLWRAAIAEPREMYPWIRGWGADVEVKSPAELRDTMAQEARALAALYPEMEKND